jgi:hypothetical protein
MFDPLNHLPDNLLPTASRIQALMDFFEQNGRAPTEEEAIALIGEPVELKDRTDPLPDGFAGRDWNNPKWLRRLQQKQQ